MKDVWAEKLNNHLTKDWFCLMLLFFFVFVLAFPIIFFGVPNGYDLPQHFQFAFTYLESIKAGNFLPGWSAAENFGFGGIGIRFYPPLAHYSLALTQLLTGDWMITTWLNILFWMLLASIGAYLLAKEWLSPLNSLWVGILYAVAPYHLSQIYQFFLYSEYVGAAILPFCFLFLTRLCRNGKAIDAIGLGCFSALLILSHIPTTIIGVVCLALFAVVILDWKKAWKIIPKLLLSGLIALLSTSFYWLRLVTELNLVNHSSPKFSTGVYGYQGFFFPMFFNSLDLYFVKQMWFKDITSIFTLIFILPITFLLIKRVKKDYLAMVAAGGFAFFMSSSLSSFLWANLSFLQKIQFPFRWLSVATLLGVLVFVIALKEISFSNFKKYLLIVLFFGMFLFDVSQIILPSEALTRERFEQELEGLAEKESFDCWWTIWSKNEAFRNKEKVAAESRQVTINKWDSEHREFEVAPGNSANARIGTFYYQHWQATVNGEIVEIGRNSDGTISIPLPTSSAKVSLSFKEPFQLSVAKILSITIWIFLLAAGIFFCIRKYRVGLKLEVVG